MSEQKQIDTGGPAFAAMNETCGQDGMTILDYFAGQALPKVIEDYCRMAEESKPNDDGIARTAYGVAAAMIAEKRRRGDTAMSEQCCVLCKEPIENHAGNPDRWGVALPIPNGQGKDFPHHIGCVVDRLYGTKPSEQLEQLARDVAWREANNSVMSNYVPGKFIAEAIQSATADLRREVEGLRQSNETQRKAAEVLYMLQQEVQRERNNLKAENDRLRSAVGRAHIELADLLESWSNPPDDLVTFTTELAALAALKPA